ncbi:hypothetical protein ANOM_000915 [Aspergillus nomiae NRRL 13137]|uniref:Uncharacterized protein n=1 Tax=Aspergillus nomiae NRRL (strain ATCC 15546 / NRRL 13137 / CBS 260.88 / M93) TaxID=1509407 RepID=A0A0L1JGB2_ASPN3|nr:uncharacterized protein ANOM_000915 [Aspergillus nomiae NRRL 13137]KNG90815.1 hypothetical protein ANOM_000915 [Aspergillus nomiae NRRL 13137]
MATGPSPLPPTFILNSKPRIPTHAGISEHGPVSRTTAAAPNLTIHNLKRVKAGLAGEVLGRDLALAKLEEGDAQPVGANGDWEDAKKFQEGENGDVMQDENDVQGQMEVDDAEQEAGALDKEERKRKKKERRLAEKRAKAKAETQAEE